MEAGSENKLDENDNFFRDKRKGLADLEIASQRRRNEKRDGGGIVYRDKSDNASPELRGYLWNMSDDDVKSLELRRINGQLWR